MRVAKIKFDIGHGEIINALAQVSPRKERCTGCTLYTLIFIDTLPWSYDTQVRFDSCRRIFYGA